MYLGDTRKGVAEKGESKWGKEKHALGSCRVGEGWTTYWNTR